MLFTLLFNLLKKKNHTYRGIFFVKWDFAEFGFFFLFLSPVTGAGAGFLAQKFAKNSISIASKTQVRGVVVNFKGFAEQFTLLRKILYYERFFLSN